MLREDQREENCRNQMLRGSANLAAAPVVKIQLNGGNTAQLEVASSGDL